jgi:hypothetical protein
MSNEGSEANHGLLNLTRTWGKGLQSVFSLIPVTPALLSDHKQPLPSFFLRSNFVQVCFPPDKTQGQILIGLNRSVSP